MLLQKFLKNLFELNNDKEKNSIIKFKLCPCSFFLAKLTAAEPMAVLALGNTVSAVSSTMATVLANTVQSCLQACECFTSARSRLGRACACLPVLMRTMPLSCSSWLGSNLMVPWSYRSDPPYYRMATPHRRQPWQAHTAFSAAVPTAQFAHAGMPAVHVALPVGRGPSGGASRQLPPPTPAVSGSAPRPAPAPCLALPADPPGVALAHPAAGPGPCYRAPPCHMLPRVP
jgi:hypothetical protein